MPYAVVAGPLATGGVPRPPARRKKSSRERKLQHLNETFRGRSLHIGIGVLLLMVPLYLEWFAPDTPFVVKLGCGILGGLVAGFLAHPDWKYLHIGLTCGLLAGVLCPLALYGYLAAMPPGKVILAKELAVVWGLAFLPGYVLYAFWIVRVVLRDTPPEPAPRPTETAEDAGRVPLSLWRRLPAVVILGALAALGWAVVLHEDAWPRRVLFSLLGIGFTVASIGVLFVRFENRESAQRYERVLRGHGRAWRLVRGMLAVLGAVWLAFLVGIIAAGGDTDAGIKVFAMSALYSLAAAFGGYIWLGVRYVQDGRPWPSLPLAGVRLRYHLHMFDPVWQHPKRYARPFALFMFGAASLLATIAVLVVVSRLPHGAPAANAAAPVQPAARAAAAWTVERGPRTYLADLKAFDVHAGPWPVSNGHVGDGRPVVVGGMASPKGIGMHPPDHGQASARYRLDREAAVFKGAVAINDTSFFTQGAAVFEVLGDGKRLWQSSPMQKGKAPEEYAVDVSRVDVLELRVSARGPNLHLHAVWLEPRLLPKADTPDR